MLSANEIVRSLTGAWMLFRAKPEGLAALDRTLAGFWRSFAVILLILPLNAVSVLAIARVTPSESFGTMFTDGLPVLALDWIAFPLLLALAAGPLGISATYPSYVVARNWAAPIAAAVLTLPFLLQGAGWVGPSGAVFLTMIALGLVLRYHYVILRIALGTTVATSLALTIVDVLLTLLIVAALN